MRYPVLLLATLASGFLAFAQTDRATISGVVTDPSQGVGSRRQGDSSLQNYRKQSLGCDE